MEQLIQDIDARLARAACDVVVESGPEALANLRRTLEQCAVDLAATGAPGLVELAEVIRRAASIATAADMLTTVQIADAAWTQWKASHEAEEGSELAAPTVAAIVAPPAGQERAAAPSAPAEAPEPPASRPTVEADVEALAMDPELSAMFIAEAIDHLGTIEATVLELETAPTDNKLLNDVFRPFHTVKGNSGALGVQTVQELAHRVENLLDLCRSGRHEVGAVEIDVILKAVDLLTTMITDLGHRLAGQPGVDVEAERQALMVTVQQVIDGGGAPAAAPAAVPVAAAAAPAEPEPEMTFDVPAPAPPVAAAPVAPMPAAPAPAAARRAAEDAGASVKVDTRKLDNLVDMVGELVIVQSIIHEDPSLQAAADERLTRNLAQLRRITSELQRNAMAMRMVPIRQTFQKMARLVRDLGKMSGKSVDFVMAGEDTELDRKVVEDINDPLMHMIRNSMDHGIEDPAVREANGKRAQGRLELKAYHQGGNIVIEIADDGGGLNTEKILQKAVAQGLVAPDAALPASEIHQLIFKPGFSTADQVTEISGRGVGMDVVRRNIEALRGRIEIQSAPGVGTTFQIKLPLTLAIVDGLLLRLGTERYVLPTSAVRESLRPQPAHVHSVQGQQCMVQVREQLIPLAPLGSILGVGAGDVTDPSEGTVVVIEDDGRQVALLVDELVGKQEVVIKALGESFKGVRGVAGGAILGDGRIGLILDGNSIVKLMQGASARAAA
ncbi:MAG: chemotaxis protein CheA [Vicinamibacterales bacterium]